MRFPVSKSLLLALSVLLGIVIAFGLRTGPSVSNYSITSVNSRGVPAVGPVASGTHKQAFVIAVLLSVALPLLGQSKPNLSGTWKLQSTEAKETLKIEHQEPKLHLIWEIEDSAGQRTLDLKVSTDGKEHKQEVQGLPATVIAKWNAEDLIFEVKRQATFGKIHNLRTMKLSKDGKTITAERIDYDAEGIERRKRTETWQKQ